MELTNNFIQDRDEDNLIRLTINLSNKIKEVILKSVKEDQVHITPFFHFDILDENEDSIFTSHDCGDDVLMFLTELDFNEINNDLVEEIVFLE